MSKRLSLKLFHTMHPNSQIKIKRSNIPNAGKGAFAAEDLEAHKIIGEYLGEPCNENSNGDYVLDINVIRKYEGVERRVKICLDAKKLSTSNWTRYINSVTALNKEDRNVEFVVFGEYKNEKVGIRTLRHIEKDEELLLDYGNEYF